MKRPCSVIVLALCSTFFVAGTSLAESITINPVKDNTLYESPTGSLSNGAGVAIFVGRTGQVSNFRRRGVIGFDVAGSLPAGSTITSAVLHLTLGGGGGSSPTINLHRLTADWGEGTSNAAGAGGGGGGGTGAPATAGDATWLHTFFPADTWSTVGGDFEPTASASAVVGFASSAVDWGTTPEMLSDVQLWLDSPGANFGWILVGNEATPATATKFESRESFVSEFRPELRIVFAGPPIAVPAMSNWGVVVTLLSFMIAGSIVISRGRRVCS